MSGKQETNQIQMGLEMQARAELIYQDVKGETCNPWLPATTVSGLQLDLRPHCEIIHYSHPVIRGWNLRPRA